ncbi:alpha/beta fold hydrolase [Neobacillus sp. DY30]|uniref:alpha/beta fold hydrolase n=1 Tax=Neobacillus sp. DY30 TaxID=3047871 RepID=UPI0024BF2521|nr:alpha/beta fold hydrolase [Neobacillus sp. DY30]WHX98149.1 alpha/beta fold hydrolase [Neobacillus sp. DY30]
MRLKNGEYQIQINSIKHWIKIEGSEHQTTPLVLLHGGPGGNHYTFERTIGPLLSEKRTVVYYEQRGCGRSQKPVSDEDYKIEQLISDFSEIKKWLDVDKVDLLGYSFGGELALEIAYALPDAINKIVLSGPSLIDLEMGKFIQIAGLMSVGETPLLKQINELLKQNLPINILYEKVWNLVDTKTVDRLLFQNQSIASQNRKLWSESQLTNTGLMAKIIMSHPLEIPLLDRLNHINQQTLIITGIFDRNTGLTISKLIHSALKNSQLVLFKESAHFPDLEEPYHFRDTVLNFLNS